MPAEPELCFCGLPLHYTDPNAERVVRHLVATLGPLIDVSVDGRTWRVPRHYIALHGLRGHEVATLGFDEVTGG